jgi:biopolymer transport protein TolR
MAFSVRGKGDINVTPLIDVLLVLLVIFVIVIPHDLVFEDVRMPSHEIHVEPQPHLIVRVNADLSVVITDEDAEIQLPARELSAGLRAHLRDEHHVVFVEVAEELPWAEVVSTVESIHAITPDSMQVALRMAE